jgi:hypothetical protein
MITSDSMSLGDCLAAITHMVNRRPKMSSIQDSLLLSRIKLGSAIEHLESLHQPADVLEQLRGHVESIAVEIDALLESIHE